MLNFKKFLGVVVLSTLAMGALAEDPGFTLSAKLGQHNIDLPGADSGSAFGVGVGYSFGSWAIEGEYTSSSSGVSGIDFDISTKALYGVYRSSGDAYFLGKIGYLNESVDASFDISFDTVFGSVSESVNESESESGMSYGIGGGFRATDNFGIELEYTIIEEDVDLIALSARFLF